MTMPNFVVVGQTVAEILSVVKMAISTSLDFKKLKF